MLQKEINWLLILSSSMKKTVRYFFVFILGVVVTTVFCKICNAIESKKYDDSNYAGDIITVRESNLELGRNELYGIPCLNSTLDDLSSNRIDKATWLLRIKTWWDLEDAWCISQKYDGALSNDLNPLIIQIYPKLKKEVDLQSFKIFPKIGLVEMSNFMKAADSMTNPENPKK